MTLELAAGTYTVEWFGITTRETVIADRLVVDHSATVNLNAPFEAAGPTVVYLKRITL